MSKSVILISALFLLWFSACKNKTKIESPQAYNDTIVKYYLRATKQIDTVLLNFLQLKYELEHNSDSIFRFNDTIFISSIDKAGTQILNSIEQLENIEYPYNDQDYKKTALTSLRTLDSIIKNTALPVVKELKFKQGEKCYDALQILNRDVKAMFISYQKSIFETSDAQLKFSAYNGYNIHGVFIQPTY